MNLEMHKENGKKKQRSYDSKIENWKYKGNIKAFPSSVKEVKFKKK